tara:strand:- start:136 stop:1278 length:1143 start_codon:yes stop_codon:yes gene_type:complete
MYIDDTDDGGTDIQTFLRTIDDSTSTVKGHVRISNKSNAEDFALFTISGTNSEQSGYFIVSVSYVSGSTSFSNGEDIIVTFARTGTKGDTGAQGTQGRQGTTGSQGTQGRQGRQGTFGSQGTAGSNGSQGIQGRQGTQGRQGAQGIQGTQGRQGTQGTLGNTGAQGTQGRQGTTGSTGSQGTQGRQGRQGTQGRQGQQGIKGEQGVQGRQGRQGTVGNQGSQGRQGTQGRQGRQGTTGSQGTQGPGGPSTTINAASSTGTTLHPVLVDALGSNHTALSNTNFNFNASTGRITANSFQGDGSGITGVSAANSYYYFGINKNKNDVTNYGKLSFTEVNGTTSVDYSEKNDFIREEQPILQDFIAPGGVTASISATGHLVLSL